MIEYNQSIYPKPWTLSPKPQTLNPKPYTQTPTKAQTPIKAPESGRPKPRAAGAGGALP